MIFHGIWTSTAKELYNFVILRRFGSGPLPPSGSAHVGGESVVFSPGFVTQIVLCRHF